MDLTGTGIASIAASEANHSKAVRSLSPARAEASHQRAEASESGGTNLHQSLCRVSTRVQASHGQANLPRNCLSAKGCEKHAIIIYICVMETSGVAQIRHHPGASRRFVKSFPPSPLTPGRFDDCYINSDDPNICMYVYRRIHLNNNLEGHLGNIDRQGSLERSRVDLPRALSGTMRSSSLRLQWPITTICFTMCKQAMRIRRGCLIIRCKRELNSCLAPYYYYHY